MTNDVQDGIYWGALCDECAGALVATVLHAVTPHTYAIGCEKHGVVGLIVCN
jgi:hypothetical protein